MKRRIMLNRIVNGIALAAALAVAMPTPAPGQGLPRAEPEAAGMSGARLARIDTVMQIAVDSARAAGIAVLLLRDGQVVKSGSYGWADLEARRPLRTDALFRIASQTKAVTSVAVMMLVEEGKLRLSDPVQRWMPTFAGMTVVSGDGSTPARRPITIRDLLTHSAGLSYGTEPSVRQAYAAAGLGPAAGHGWYFADKDEPICTTLDRLGTLPLVAHPGERFVYGYGTDVLGCVVERVSGRALDEFFRERIFRPLRMNDTHFFLPPAEPSRLVAVYAAGSGGLRRADEGATGQGAYVDGPRASFSGGAGLVSSIEDYARFLQMLLNGGELEGARILAPHTIVLMTTDHLGALYTSPGLGFGLGFEVLEDPGHAGRYGAPGAYGWGGAYATTYWVDPEERLVALIMTQTLPSGGLDAADRFRTLVYSALLQPALRP
jgi:CubicO group peptidase (beta-lactamase class C family)